MSHRNIDLQSVHPAPKAFAAESGAVRMNGFKQSRVQLGSAHRPRAYVP
jgi:hypothetical protein